MVLARNNDNHGLSIFHGGHLNVCHRFLHLLEEKEQKVNIMFSCEATPK